MVDLGLVHDISVEEDTGEVTVPLTLASPLCPLGPEIVAAVKQAHFPVRGRSS